MPLYTNPDFRRLPDTAAAIFSEASEDSFFALPGWYDLMARHGVTPDTQIRLYTDERPGSAMALCLQRGDPESDNRLLSLANPYSVEHGVLANRNANLEVGLTEIITNFLADRPRWDCLSLAELDPREPAYESLVRVLRRAGLIVERVFHSGTWYEDTAGLNFDTYLAARPAQLRNTYRRKRQRLETSGQLTQSFVADLVGIDNAIRDYQTVYAASWKPAEPFPSFMPALIRLGAETGALRLGIYYLDGVPAAAQFWIVWNGRAIIYKLAHDERFDEFSLGTVLTMDMIERVLREDRPAEINFGRGDDAYKKLWLSKRRERWGIIAANPRTIRGMRLGVWREAAKVYHRLRGERLTPSMTRPARQAG